MIFVAKVILLPALALALAAPAQAAMRMDAVCLGSPELIAKQFMSALDARNYQAAYGSLSTAARARLTFDAFRQHYELRTRQLGGQSLTRQFAMRGQSSYSKIFSRTTSGVQRIGPSEWTVSFLTEYPAQPVPETVDVVCEGTSLRVGNFNG